jgi:hypothetical protein
MRGWSDVGWGALLVVTMVAGAGLLVLANFAAVLH